MSKEKQKAKESVLASEKFFRAIAYVFMTILSLMAILPCLHVISKAVSTGENVISGNVLFWPRGFQLEAISYVLKETEFFNALKNSLIVTICGTAIAVFTTITTAYPLSKSSFKGHRVITMFYVISMVFYGGMVPAYMVVRTLGILDTYAACILPFAIVPFNMFVMKSYFEGLPESIEESARMDGAGDIRILTAIVVPMSKPVIATITLLYAITYWNNYFHVTMYTKSASMRTLQVYLYNVIYNSQTFAENTLNGLTININSEGILAAAVTMSLVPIVALYPFVSRYFIQGITIGSVKG
jgi:putative aldouronate transport system permease protein